MGLGEPCPGGLANSANSPCPSLAKMLLNSLNRDMFKPFRSHRGLLGLCSCRVLEDHHSF